MVRGREVLEMDKETCLERRKFQRYLKYKIGKAAATSLLKSGFPEIFSGKAESGSCF